MIVTMIGSSFLPLSLTTTGAGARQAEPGEGLPGEIVLDDQRFTFDRGVPVDLSQLEERSGEAGSTVYVKPEGDPLNAVYVPGATDGNIAARYLPQYLNAPQTTCPSETLDVGTIQSAGGTFVVAGLETDLASEDLVEIGSTDDGRTVYASSGEPPFNELFVTGIDEGLVRFVLLSDEGPPAALPQQLTFAGQQFQIASGEEADVDEESLARIGCAAQLPAFAGEDESASPYSTIYVQVGDRFVAYQATGTSVSTPAPGTPLAAGTSTIPATPEATMVTTPGTPVETLAPIGPPEMAETETPAPTATSTATIEPTSTVSPTETPAPTATASPTATPEPTSTSDPTEVPEPTSTAEPTEVSQPTSTAVSTATDAATVADTPQPTTTPGPAPVETQTPPTATEEVVPRPTPTPQQSQQAAVVPTLPPGAPPPAVATAPATRCSGDPGVIGGDGVPESLPLSIQYGGTGYEFTGIVAPEDTGARTLVGCVGPFEAFRSDQEDANRDLFLVLPNLEDSVFRYQATASFTVDFEVTDDPRVLTLLGTGDEPDTQYVANEPWVRSAYSSVTVVLYVADPQVDVPQRIFGRAVDADAIGEYLPEGEAEMASDEVLATAEDAGILPELRLGTSNERYVLDSLWRPIGTTTNGWLTLYGPAGEERPSQLLGTDPRRLDLLVFDRSE